MLHTHVFPVGRVPPHGAVEDRLHRFVARRPVGGAGPGAIPSISPLSSRFQLQIPISSPPKSKTMSNQSSPTGRTLLIGLATATIFLMPSQGVRAQGCIPAHHLSLGLGDRGISYLEARDWEASLSYGYLHSHRVFMGGEEQPQLHAGAPRNTFHTIDLTATYALHRRFDLSFTIPFIYNDASSVDDDGVRRTVTTEGLGDLRLIGTTWLLDPARHANGNVSIGVGPKFPTGDSTRKGPNHKPDGTVAQESLVVTQQPGDGGWGIVLQMQAFRKLMDRLYGYGTGFYLVNPENTSSINSIADAYSGRLGLSYEFWPALGLSFSFGGRIDGTPVRDLIGDSYDGFRRAGYSIYVDPALSWSSAKNRFSVGVPVAVDRYEARTLSDQALSKTSGTRVGGRGGFADFLVTVSYARRF